MLLSLYFKTKGKENEIIQFVIYCLSFVLSNMENVFVATKIQSPWRTPIPNKNVFLYLIMYTETRLYFRKEVNSYQTLTRKSPQMRQIC